MKIAIIHSVSGQSAKVIKEALLTRSHGAIKEVDIFKPFEDGHYNFYDYDYVLSLGCSEYSEGATRLNKPAAVSACVSKPKTFEALKKAGVNTVPYVLRKKDVPKDWDTVVIRTKKDGRKAEGLFYANQCDDEPIPDGELFTRHFDHKYEYRIMVFMGKVVGRYYKREEEGEWYFELQPAKGFETMDDHCLRAAKALGIDYVGFDVVAVNKKNFAILEANSGARITDEAETAIVEYFINL